MESSDSMSTTSGEFEIVADVRNIPVPAAAPLLATSPPTLNIAYGDLQDLEQNLKEMIRETEKSPDTIGALNCASALIGIELV